LAVLFRRYSPSVRRIAYRILRDAAEADDLLQDIFLLIHRLSGTFDGSKASVQFWIVQMSYRRAISRRRYLHPRQFYSRLPLDEQLLQSDNRCPERGEFATEQHLLELDLEKMFELLSENQQRTLRLHFIEGYTLEEIAKILGQTKGNIRHHSFRGL